MEEKQIPVWENYRSDFQTVGRTINITKNYRRSGDSLRSFREFREEALFQNKLPVHCFFGKYTLCYRCGVV